MKRVASAEWGVATDSVAGPAREPRVLLLGIGNLLWADEGFGVRCIEAMALRYRFGPNVSLLDGGTQGLYLVDQVRTADVLVVFDAVDYGLLPGTLKRVEGDEVPQFLGAKKMSLHQTGFQEVLALADLLGDAPSRLLLIGVQPVELEDFGGSLRPEVKAALYPAIDLALDYLAGLGVRPLDDARAAATSVSATMATASGSMVGSGADSATTGAGAFATVDSAASEVPAVWSSMGHEMRQDLPHPALDLAVYELGRPPPELACRSGDERVLAKRAKLGAAGSIRSSVLESAQPSASDSPQPSATDADWLSAGRCTGPNVGPGVRSSTGWPTAPLTSTRMSQ
ncbi:HyaD/HybD family hydrogenase maturation endopeptidase [Lamprobacter modestohalophilus]|uniref:HyaD/HybD family hydrogenase maturation endopeptidase n=1 Tax=Lamprobacter modestohalophilus TaxID=1064514 RepID=UPI003D18C565